MRPKFFIMPYGPSNSARALAEALVGRVLKRVNSKYRNRIGDVVINWGSKHVPIAQTVVNKPAAVNVASSKLLSFEAFRANGVATVESTQDQRVAQEWAATSRVFGRDSDRGYAGRGITVYEQGAVVGRHLFYTKYIRKQREFRFHIYQGRVVRVLEKLKKNGYENPNKYIRGHLHGWVFASNHFGERPIPEGLEKLALAACRAVGLDFGGVDIGWSDRTGGVVYEVNTAPGLEGRTITAYAMVIKETHANV